jgi:hypothetical protein
LRVSILVIDFSVVREMGQSDKELVRK